MRERVVLFWGGDDGAFWGCRLAVDLLAACGGVCYTFDEACLGAFCGVPVGSVAI